ncbi:MAG: hypothetical protein GY814_11370 [Gammaproteobacteria bacterium]|nr:hypothetical protein [Gammaproteobacteria bacterium]
MLTKQVILPITVVLLFSAYQAGAETAEQQNSIRYLGQLNGVALHCNYIDQMRRMKRVLVTALPRRRHLGQLFDDVTNTSFLEFIKSKSVCPGEQQFLLKVDAAVAVVNQAFSKP